MKHIGILGLILLLQSTVWAAFSRDNDARTQRILGKLELAYPHQSLAQHQARAHAIVERARARAIAYDPSTGVEDFEGAFPADYWTATDQDALSGEVTWGVVDCRACEGSRSAWCAATQSNPCDEYAPDQYAQLSVECEYLGLSLDNSDKLPFTYWVSVHNQQDYLQVMLEGWRECPGPGEPPDVVELSERYGSTQQCTLETLSLGTRFDPIFYVRVTFIFRSDSQGETGEGAYIDNIVLNDYGSGASLAPFSGGFEEECGFVVPTATPTPPPTATPLPFPDIRVDPMALRFSCDESATVSALASADSVWPPADKRIDAETLDQRLAADGRVKVIVNLKPPAVSVADLRSTGHALDALHAQVQAVQERVLASVATGQLRVRHRYDNIAGFSCEVSGTGLKRVLAHEAVESVQPVRTLTMHTRQGLSLMNADPYRLRYSGAGLSIAICDTGIDTRHSAFGGGGFPNDKVIGGYDFGDRDDDPRTGGEAHGTAVAGIAAGTLLTNGDYTGGVAYDAKLYALKISPGASGSASDDSMIAAWDWCVTHQNDDPDNPIMVINTSFGGDRLFAQCDGDSPAMTRAAQAAVSAGITVLVSAGNDGWCDSISWPACISHAIAVGAVYDGAPGRFYPCVDRDSCADKERDSSCGTGWFATDEMTADSVTSYSNSASILDLYAPAEMAHSPDIVGSGGYASGDYVTDFGGTSAACPYAAGAVAVLQQAARNLTGAYLSPAKVREILTTTGVAVTDTKSNLTRPRIDLGAAIESLSTTERRLTVHNDGGVRLRVTAIRTQPPVDWIDWTPKAPFDVDAGMQVSLQVTVDCDSASRSESTVLVIESTDPDENPLPGGVDVSLQVTVPSTEPSVLYTH